MGAGASVEGGGGGEEAIISEEVVETACSLKDMPEAIEQALFVHEKWPLIIDSTGQAGRFLRYQRGSFLMADSPADMDPSKLRQLLVGALRHGSR